MSSSDSESDFKDKKTKSPEQLKKMADGRAKKNIERINGKLKELDDRRKAIEDMLRDVEKEEIKLKKALAEAEKSLASPEDDPKPAEPEKPKKVTVVKAKDAEPEKAKKIASGGGGDPEKPKKASAKAETESETESDDSSGGKKSKKSIPKAIKTLVWNRYIGHDVANAMCYCCESTEIKNTHFHCGHVVPEAKGGTMEISNLRPICAPCNLSMGTRHLEEFKATFGLGKAKPKKK